MRKNNLKNFDYAKVAKLDADMWRAYYNHQFLGLFFLLVRLVKTQVGFGWLSSIRLAGYAAWAAADYRIHKKQGVKTERVLKNLVKFYKYISERSVDRFDYVKAAKLELAWWEIHRRSYKNNPELERSLADGAAAIYNVPSSALKEYAHYRAEAMICLGMKAIPKRRQLIGRQ